MIASCPFLVSSSSAFLPFLLLSTLPLFPWRWEFDETTRHTSRETRAVRLRSLQKVIRGAAFFIYFFFRSGLLCCLSAAFCMALFYGLAGPRFGGADLGTGVIWCVFFFHQSMALWLEVSVIYLFAAATAFHLMERVA